MKWRVKKAYLLVNIIPMGQLIPVFGELQKDIGFFG
jgi:hypothetical protein